MLRSLVGSEMCIRDSYRNTHTSNYSELYPNQQVWMQHHISGKWDTKVTVRSKREEGNSYVVCAQDGNTYIRGRRLLNPINHPQYLLPSRTPRTRSPKTPPSATQPPTKEKKPKKKKRDIEDQKMPRRSPRNHNSTRAADTEIAAHLTTFHIYEFEDGEAKPEALSLIHI